MICISYYIAREDVHLQKNFPEPLSVWLFIMRVLRRGDRLIWLSCTDLVSEAVKVELAQESDYVFSVFRGHLFAIFDNCSCEFPVEILDLSCRDIPYIPSSEIGLDVLFESPLDLVERTVGYPENIGTRCTWPPLVALFWCTSEHRSIS